MLSPSLCGHMLSHPTKRKAQPMFTLTFQTSNAAFEGAEASETARILRDIAARIESGNLEGPARDENGNTVGRYALNAD